MSSIQYKIQLNVPLLYLPIQNYYRRNMRFWMLSSSRILSIPKDWIPLRLQCWGNWTRITQTEQADCLHGEDVLTNSVISYLKPTQHEEMEHVQPSLAATQWTYKMQVALYSFDQKQPNFVQLWPFTESSVSRDYKSLFSSVVWRTTGLDGAWTSSAWNVQQNPQGGVDCHGTMVQKASCD